MPRLRYMAIVLVLTTLRRFIHDDTVFGLLHFIESRSTACGNMLAQVATTEYP